MNLWMRRVGAVVRKDLSVEWRTREVLASSFVFALVLVTLFYFAGFEDPTISLYAAPAILWVSIAFVGTIIFGRTVGREREGRAIEALVLIPDVSGPLFVGKLVVNLVLLLGVELLLVPLTMLLFRADLLPVALPLGLTLLAGSLGFCALGTVLSAALSAVRMREVILPVVLYALSIPLLVMGIEATRQLVSPTVTGGFDGWLGMMLAFDAVFLVVGRWLFGFALDSAGG